uniref:Uncharacterized protein n=1 Tax=Poecilia reticulata TaxID=8081 RepID=A0A3P9MVI7_POERE
TTITSIETVADREGLPPSVAVRVNFISDCFSRSKGFCRIISTDTVGSPPFCASSAKCSLWLSL